MKDKDVWDGTGTHSYAMLTSLPGASLPLVFVVPVAWKHMADIRKCLLSLSQMTYANFCLVLVDNGSMDGTAAAVQARFPQVKVIVNPENLGFSGGLNVGLRHG